MTGARGRWLLFATVLSCRSSVSQQNPIVANESMPAGLQPSRQVFQEVCVPCHDGPSPDKPDFAKPLSTSVAALALAAASRRSMPPPLSGSARNLDEQERVSVAGYLCRQTGRKQSACAELLANAFRPRMARKGVAIVAMLRKKFEKLDEKYARFLGGMSSNKPSAHLEPELVMLALKVVMGACATQVPLSATDSDDEVKCVVDTLREVLASPNPGASQ